MVRVANEYLACACRVQQDNPKKNMSADRYERYKAARTLQQVLDLGGSRGDIANDMLRGYICLLYTSPSPRDQRGSRMPSSA